MALTFSHSLRIEAPPERVFSAATDLSAFARWMPNFVGVERLTDGAVGVGSQFRETRKMYGRSSTEHFEFVAFDPPRGFTLLVDGTKGTTGKGEFRFAHTLTALDDGAATQFALDGGLSGLSKIAELFGRLFIGSMKKAIAADLRALKAYIEQLPEADDGLADAPEAQQEVVAGTDGLEGDEGARQDDLAGEQGDVERG